MVKELLSKLKFLDFFSGIGGFRLGFEMAGHECVGHVEWDKYAQQSYTAMHNVKEDEYVGWDIREVKGSDLPRADVWNFGAPCQDFSISGQRAGLEGDKSSLVREVFRLVRETEEENRPEWLLYENVKGMLSSNGGRDFLAIIIEMESLGYDIQWQTLNSKNFGVPQNRERVFTLGHSRRYSSRKVFPIEGTDSEVGLEVNVVGKTDPNRNSDHNIYGTDGIIGTLLSRDYKQPKQIIVGLDKSYNLREIDIANCITSREDRGLSNRKAEGTMIAVAEDEATIKLLAHRDGYRRNTQVFDPSGIVETLDTGAGGGRGHYTIVDDMYANREPRVYEDYAPTLRSDRTGLKVVEPKILALRGRPGTDGEYIQRVEVNKNGVSNTITSVQKDNLLQENTRIRKLTPLECWRLQGFPDEYFERAKNAGVSDSQLYRQSGNSVTITVIYEIAKRL